MSEKLDESVYIKDIKKIDNGWLVTSYYWDGGNPEVVTAYTQQDNKYNDNRLAEAKMLEKILWDILEILGFYNSHHEKYISKFITNYFYCFETV